MDSEWAQMLNTFKRLGIEFKIDWQPGERSKDGGERRRTFEAILKKAGFCITILATNAIVVGDVYYVFSTGEPHWTAYKNDPEDMDGHKGWGSEGMFMFSWNMKTGVDTLRCVQTDDGLRNVIATGLDALKFTHGPIPEFTPRG